MPRQLPILPVDLVRQFGNMNVQKPALPHGSNTFIRGALVTNTAGVLAAVAAGGLLCYGQTPDRSHTTGETVPDTLPREGQLGSTVGQIVNQPFSPLDAEFELNLGVAPGGVLTLGATTITSTGLAVGDQCGIAIITSPAGDPKAGIQLVDKAAANKLFVITAIPTAAPDGQPVDPADFNPRVRVKIIPSCIQN